MTYHLILNKWDRLHNKWQEGHKKLRLCITEEIINKYYIINTQQCKQHVNNTDRGTNLVKDGVSIQTSEHVLAALVGMSVDNCYEFVLKYIRSELAKLPIRDDV